MAPSPTLRLLQTLRTRHGNAANSVWSEDGRSLYLANEEGAMSAVRLEASDPRRPRIAANSGRTDFLWSVDLRDGLLTFRSSYGEKINRLDPASLNTVWERTLPLGHSVATDGARVFAPVTGRPGALHVLRGSDGGEMARVPMSEPWGRVYATVWHAASRRLYVGVSSDRQNPDTPGGLFIFEDQRGTMAAVGRIDGATSNVAVAGTKLWRAAGPLLEAWDAADPKNPRRVGLFTGPTVADNRGAPLPLEFGQIAVNRAGTRLYALFRFPRDAQQRPQGFMIFDVTGASPAPLAEHAWRTELGLTIGPMCVSVSPAGREIAVSYWDFGVRFFGVEGDRVAEQGLVPTTGEARDVYVDRGGHIYAFCVDDVQVLEPSSGDLIHVYKDGLRTEGRWGRFRGGTVILPGRVRRVLRLENGRVELAATMPEPGTGSVTWCDHFEDPFLYSATERGLYIQRVDPFEFGTGRRQVPYQTIGRVDPGRADDRPGAVFYWLTKTGSTVWAIGANTGVAAFDVSDPTSPRTVFHDKFTFKQNGNSLGIVAARGRVYAGAGDAGVFVYDARQMRRTGAFGQGRDLFVNFLDLIDDDYLIVANYWQPRLPEGIYVYDLRANPDAPPLVDRHPKPQGGPNFRVRVLGDKIFRVPLHGIDILELRDR
jgi:hypothetical protein